MITNAVLIIAHTGFSEDLGQKLILHAGKAEKRLRALISDDTYEELSSRPAADPDRERVAQAESLLSVYFALPFLNLRITKTGGIIKTTGLEPTQTEIMNKTEMEKYRYNFLSQALLLIDDLILEDIGEAGDLKAFDGGTFGMDAVGNEDD